MTTSVLDWLLLLVAAVIVPFSHSYHRRWGALIALIETAQPRHVQDQDYANSLAADRLEQPDGPGHFKS